ncbi:MAG: Uma2 family endonuclease [Scytolyngbya sp. HA4215-MV1]|jgi:Uma2 family endonuclease|nr:Uma2 family endonuclease [Scytolyngbya sp. HA4215-MV1]
MNSKTASRLRLKLGTFANPRLWFTPRPNLYLWRAVKLTRHGKDWVPVPDLLYVSHERLPADWMQNEACPISPDLVVEIVPPGQTFGEMTEKATDYLAAGVLRVWVVNSQAKSVTVFVPESLPQTYRENRTIADPLFLDLTLTAEQLFQPTGVLG